MTVFIWTKETRWIEKKRIKCGGNACDLWRKWQIKILPKMAALSSFFQFSFFFLAYVALLDSWERERERELIKMGDVVWIWFLILWYWLLSLRDRCWTCYVFCLIHDLILRTKFGLSLWDCTVEFETFTDTITYIIIK